MGELIFLLIPTQLPLLINVLATVLNLVDWWQNGRRPLPLLTALGSAGAAGVYVWFIAAAPPPGEAQPFFRLANAVIYAVPVFTAIGNLRAYRAASQIKALTARIEVLERDASE